MFITLRWKGKVIIDLIIDQIAGDLRTYIYRHDFFAKYHSIQFCKSSIFILINSDM